jgi:large subunit ribosomal protein L35
MPKLKTNSGAAKRFKLTKRGKVKFKRAKLRHILTTKPKKQKRRLRKPGQLDKTNIKQIKRLLPYA